MSTLSTKTKYENYQAKVVKLSKFIPHPNADRLQIAVVDFQNVVTSKEQKEGDLAIYFPVECAINKDFLKFSNLFNDASLNEDPNKKGYINKRGRIRCIKLRDFASEGYLHPLSKVNEWLANIGEPQITEKDVGTTFDTVGKTPFVTKYVPNNTRQSKEAGARDSKNKKKEETRLVDGQFHLHSDTSHLKKNLHRIEPDDLISVQYKYHGSAFTCANVLTKKKLGIRSKIAYWIAKAIGVEVNDKEYDLLWSSRRVVKNSRFNARIDHTDAWTHTALNLAGKVEPGISIYGEIVGFKPNGAAMQKMGGKAYDYGCEDGQSELYVYRITHTDQLGNVREFTVPQIERYCAKYGLKPCFTFFYGKASEIVNYEAPVNSDAMRTEPLPEEVFEEAKNEWRGRLLEFLLKNYNEKDCFLCKNELPEEGVVIRKEADTFTAFKLKSMRFLQHETAELDNETAEIPDDDKTEE